MTTTMRASIACRERMLDQARLHESAMRDAVRREDMDGARVYARAVSALARAIREEAR